MIAAPLDAHLHLLFPDRYSYYWWSPGLGLPDAPHGPAEARVAMDDARVPEAIVVQAHPSVEETAHLVAVARAHPWVRGVVAWVDVRDARAEERIESLAREPLVKAVRHQRGEDESAEWLLDPAALRNLRALARTRLAWDLLCRPHQLAPAAAALDRVPGLRVVLEHLGKPDLTASPGPWAADLARVAAHPGVTAKLSELLPRAAVDLRPWLEVALRCFGADRLMWGSGWPVCLPASDYTGTIGGVIGAIGRLEPGERGAILGGTARRFYRIDGEAS